MSVRVLIIPARLVATVPMRPGLIGRPVVDRNEVLIPRATQVPAAPHGVQAPTLHAVTSLWIVGRWALAYVRSLAGVPTIRVHNVPRGRMPVMHRPGEMMARVHAPVQIAAVPIALPTPVPRIRAQREMVTEAVPGLVRLMPVRHGMGSEALRTGALPVGAFLTAVPPSVGRRVRAIGPVARNNRSAPSVRLLGIGRHPDVVPRPARVRHTCGHVEMETHPRVVETVTVAVQACDVNRAIAAPDRPPVLAEASTGRIDHCCRVQLYRTCRSVSRPRCSIPRFAVNFEASPN